VTQNVLAALRNGHIVKPITSCPKVQNGGIAVLYGGKRLRGIRGEVEGVLKVGMLGGVNVLSQDILAVPAADILKTQDGSPSNGNTTGGCKGL
jgi:hypothetical protein